MTRLDPRSRIVTAHDLAKRGVSRRRRERDIASGRLVVVRHGVYLQDHQMPTGPDAAEQRLLLRTVAAAPNLREGTAFSHASALALHGLPIHGFDTGRVTTTRHRPGGGSRIGRSAICHNLDLKGAVIEKDGFLVTTVARTIVDVARSGVFDGAVAAADEALRQGMCSPTELQEEVDGAAGRRGVSVAREVVAFADGSAESVLESISRVAIDRLGLPRPELQVTFTLSSGRTVRPDFYWEDWRLFGECHGVGKYGIEAGPAEVRKALKAEKSRRSEIEADGFRSVDWLWDDAVHADRLGVLLRKGFAL